MSARKNIDKLCALVTAATLLLTLLFCNGKALGIETAARAIGYENRIFDQSRVHSIDIVTDDWEGFLETCEREEYAPCTVVIDGEAFKNVGIRGKGNTSLRSVASLGSSRYSFKLEFDQYDGTSSYHGLDKLCLNNIIQDNTFMKDYLAYTLMDRFGADAPLCSFAYLTVNGGDWGLYLAVEGVEESFLQRNYGSGYGDLYKPDSMDLGGGRGNGRDFDIDDFVNEENGETTRDFSQKNGMRGFGGKMPDNGEIQGGFRGETRNEFRGGMGSSDVKLQYIDDDPESYSNIFGNAKTDVSDADKSRLIGSLKILSEENDPSAVLNTDEVIRYFAVHNFLRNGDSYTGTMIHNYYLYEEDGRLSMIPWDYNLAFGTFQGSNASSEVNAPIDTPVSGDMSDRPMIAWIFGNEEYTALYHEVLDELVNRTDFAALIEETAARIAPYVEKDPTKFCTYEEFEKGVSAIRDFCLLRAESVRGQLDGLIPSTSDGQKADSSALIDASALTLSDMGSMNHGGNFGEFGGGNRERPGFSSANTNDTEVPSENRKSGNTPPSMDGNFPTEFGAPPSFDGNFPTEFGESPSSGGDLPANSDEQPSESALPNTDRAEPNRSSPTGEKPTEKFPSAGNNSPNGSAASPLLLGISAIVLIGGIFIAVKVKAHN